VAYCHRIRGLSFEEVITKGRVEERRGSGRLRGNRRISDGAVFSVPWLKQTIRVCLECEVLKNDAGRGPDLVAGRCFWK